jgi:regulator of sigma E protease
MGVSKNSPAAQAGIKAGDRVTAVDGKTVETLQGAVQRIRSNSPGLVTIQMTREDNPYSVTVQREEYATLLRKNGLRMLPNLGGQLKTGQLGSLQNRPTVWPRT